MLRDVEEEGYHAFNANANSIGVCGDLAGAPTPELIASLDVVLRVLHDESPEFPNLRDHEGTYGHQELAFVDTRNAGTACPGGLLPFVRQYRAEGGGRGRRRRIARSYMCQASATLR